MAKCDVDNRFNKKEEQCWYCDTKFTLDDIRVFEQRTHHTVHLDCLADDGFQFIPITPVTKDALDEYTGYATYINAEYFFSETNFTMEELLKHNVYVQGRLREGYYEIPYQSIPLPAPCIKTTVELLVIGGGRVYIANDVVAFVNPETRMYYVHHSKFT